MKCIWITDEDKVKGFKCEFSPVDMLIVVSGLKYITADIERHPKDRERAQYIYNKIMLSRYEDEAEQTEPQIDCIECKHFKKGRTILENGHCNTYMECMASECPFEPKGEPNCSKKPNNSKVSEFPTGSEPQTEEWYTYQDEQEYNARHGKE